MDKTIVDMIWETPPETEEKKYVFVIKKELYLKLMDCDIENSKYNAIPISDSYTIDNLISDFDKTLYTGKYCDKYIYCYYLSSEDNKKLRTYLNSNNIACNGQLFSAINEAGQNVYASTTHSEAVRAIFGRFIYNCQENEKKCRDGAVTKAKDILGYFKNIESVPQTYEASTGFLELDKKLNGGLHEGLYVIGAMSSLGKTTFVLQIADQIARSGKDVLFFSLEMSKYELVSKSISRYTYLLAGREIIGKDKDENNIFLAKDTMHIMNNKYYKSYSDKERNNINKAIDMYESEVSEHLYIFEGRYEGRRIDAKIINDIVIDHILETGSSPVVIIDYLQILAPLTNNSSDKQATDETVLYLKEVSRKHSIPIIAISSFNRDNYDEPVNMSSFKESGAIEYSSDVLIGLQYAGVEYQPGTTKERRKEDIASLKRSNEHKQMMKEPIDIELKCLKQRNGYKFTIPFVQISAFNTFRENVPDSQGFSKAYGNTPFTFNGIEAK